MSQNEIFDLNTATARGIVVIYAKYNDRYIPVKVLPDGSLASSVVLNASDIQIGSLEIKDSDSDIRANVSLDINKNALYVKSESLAQENTLQIVGSTINEVKDNLVLIRNKINEGRVLKEFIWDQEQLSISSTQFEIIKNINCRFVKSKTFYLRNIGNERIWVSLYMSTDDENLVPLINDQVLDPNYFLIHSNEQAFMSLKIFARSTSGNGLLLFSGYGLGG